jgi:hypothetical protein
MGIFTHTALRKKHVGESFSAINAGHNLVKEFQWKLQQAASPTNRSDKVCSPEGDRPRDPWRWICAAMSRLFP